MAAGTALSIVTCELLESVMCLVFPQLHQPLRTLVHVLTAILASSPMLYFLVVRHFADEIEARRATEESLCRARDHMTADHRLQP